MSNIQQVTIKTSGPKKEPFCRVCCNKGKSKKVYRSHYIWSEKGMGGVIVCPELKHLLNMECYYCHNIGHTSKYCYGLKMRDYGCHVCNTFNHKQKNCKIYRQRRDERRTRRDERRTIREVEEMEHEEREYAHTMRQYNEDRRYHAAMWVARHNPSHLDRIQDEYNEILEYRD